jgi:hypothetical protein
MVSMVENNDMVMDPIVPKHEPGPDGSISSSVSTPDPEAEPMTQDAAQTQKRKGGRKPVRNNFLKSGAPHSYLSSCVTCCHIILLSRLPIYISELTWSDLRHLRRTQATKSAGPGGLP